MRDQGLLPARGRGNEDQEADRVVFAAGHNGVAFSRLNRLRMLSNRQGNTTFLNSSGEMGRSRWRWRP